MRALFTIFRLMVRDQRTALIRGGLLAAVVLLMGAALLGLSGWFITAAAAAGLAGAGKVFDVFRPSALVRFLALGRTAARYGERLLTHDATLRALASLRVRLLRSLAVAPWDRLIRLRGAQALNRLTADVDALDGVPLRLILPILAGLSAITVVFVVLWVLVGPMPATWVAGGLVAGATGVLVLGARAATAPSRRAEAASQAFRTRLIDMIHARADLAVYGQLARQSGVVAQAEARRASEAARLDRIGRTAGAALSMVATGVAAGALMLGAALAGSGQITPAYAAIPVFVALALTEVIMPLRRALSDLGRMTQASRRVAAMLDVPAQPEYGGGDVTGDGRLVFDSVTFRRGAGSKAVLDQFGLTVKPGEWVALTGASGAGKSTVLLLAARMLAPEAGRILLSGTELSVWGRNTLRRAVCLVPQRAALVGGEIAENLRLAAPDASEDELWRALEAVALAETVRRRGGLGAGLGPRGAGLSGGEARRLVLARAILRCPAVLLLDEPTEGLDGATARAVLDGIRRELPDSAVLIAAHRPEERRFADRSVVLARS